MNVFFAAESVAAATDHDQISNFRSFLAEMGRRGVPEEAIPQDLQAVADLDDWVGEIRNGGNSQFIGNKGPRAEAMLLRIVSLLRSCGASAHLQVAENVLRWLKANQTEAARQTGFKGGRAEALDVLDQAFMAAERTGSIYATVAPALIARPNVRLVPETELAAVLDAEALRFMESDPLGQQYLCRAVAQQCRDWLTNPLNMGLALASGKLTDGILLPAGLPATREGDGAVKLHVFLDGLLGSGRTRNIGHARLDEHGLRFVGDPQKEPVDIFVSHAEIRRATKMAVAFRLPESVGLRWRKMGRPFSIGPHRFMVMPGSNWLPHKWRVTWVGDTDWAVKGSPNRSTFLWGEDYEQKETLMQEDIASRIADLGLKIGS